MDWFHITMRIAVLGQYAKGLNTGPENREQASKILESTKHYLWHRNVVRAQERVQDLHGHLHDEKIEGDNGRKIRRGLDEFETYIAANQARIPNYGERWRNKEAIATGFVESAVNQIVSKRLAKRQQMQWRSKGAHLLLQTRTGGLETMIDDVTSRMLARFVEHDSTEANMRLLQSYLEQNGRPVSFYTDKAALFSSTPKVKRGELAGKDRPDLPATQIGRALKELDIEWIAAHSP